jgi:hypothetical protein
LPTVRKTVTNNWILLSKDFWVGVRKKFWEH